MSENGKSGEVLTHDRCPHVQGRIIDLSQAAAKALGMIDRGVAEVQIELLQETVAAENAVSINRQ
jgi:rare lipoprotein A